MTAGHRLDKPRFDMRQHDAAPHQPAPTNNRRSECLVANLHVRPVVRLCAIVLALCFVYAVPTTLAQQVSSASLTGCLVDGSGGVLANVEVAARHLDRDQSWTTRTDSEGRFRFSTLPVGRYEIRAAVPGFTPVAQRVTLAVGETLDIPLTLSVSQMAEHVDVAERQAIVDTGRTQVAEVITPRDIDTLPLNGRNYLDLALLTPGVSRHNTRNTERFAETSAVPGTGISIAGQRNLNNNFVVDGVSANDDAAGLAGTYLGQEVVREFQVVTSGGLAEFGRTSSGVVNVITQSGSSHWRGATYAFVRDDSLDARNAFATHEDPLHQTQWGVTLGGPIAARRTFLFTNVEQTLNDRTVFVTISESARDTINRHLDALNFAGPRVETGGAPTGYDTTNVFARVDHQVRSADQLAARYNFYDLSSKNARSVGALNDESRGTSLTTRDHSVSVTYTSLPSSSLVNEVRAQFSRSRLGAAANDPVGPATSISGVANFGIATSSPTARDIDTYQVVDSVSWQRGRHLVKAGADLLYNRLDILFPGAIEGSYSFQSLAAFLTGRYTTYQQAFGEATQFQSNMNAGLFAQTEWRWRNDVTINAGVRYDLQDLETPIQTDRNNVSPRLGVSWAPGSRRTVVRASTGRYFDRIPLRAVSNALQRDGVKYRVAVVPFGTPGAPVYPQVMTAFPEGLLTAITSMDEGIETGESWQTSLQVEREVSRWLSASVGYIGVDGSKIIMSRNVNAPTLSAADAAVQGVANQGRPDPRFGNNSRFGSLGDSSYHGLVVSATTRAMGGTAFRVAYTLSKAIDTAGNAFFNSPQNNNDIADEKGLSDNDVRHRLALNGAYEVSARPDGALWRRALGGTRLSAIFTYTSPSPFNVLTGNDRNNDTNTNDRPVGVGRNTGRGFDYASLDLRVSRAIAIGGNRSVELIADAFNILNRTNLLFPNNTFGTGTTPLPGFGLATAAADPRQIQLGVRFRF